MKTRPLFFIGLDAADPVLLARFAAEGRLPAYSALVERGRSAPIRGTELVCEHGLWLGIVSGVPRSRHGYHYFRQLAPGTYDLEEVTGDATGVAPFWAGLAGTGRRAAVLDVPDAALVPGVEGFQLADWGVHDPRHVARSEPHGFAGEVRRRFGDEIRIDESWAGDDREDERTLRRLLARVALRGELVRDLFARGPFDFFGTVFSECHTAGHQFWPRRPGGRRDGGPNAFRHAIRDVYEAIDREMGAILERAPADADVVLVSSTGIDDRQPMGGFAETVCRALGWQAAPPAAPRSVLDVARRALPSGLRLAASRRLSRGMRERLVADAFRTGTDWSRTRVFSTPSAFISLVRLNLRGREPLGVVAPGDEARATLEQFAADLAVLRDPAIGRAAVKKAHFSDELFGVDRHPALPDLVVEWDVAPTFPARIDHPRGPLAPVLPEFCRANDHTSEGLLLAAGPSIDGRGPADALSALDVATTCAALLRLPSPAGATGRVHAMVRR